MVIGGVILVALIVIVGKELFYSTIVELDQCPHEMNYIHTKGW